MKIGMPDWPKLDEPVVIEYDRWWAAWGGGEYINIFTNEVGAKRSALGTNPMDGNYAVHSLNTTGDEFDPDEPEDYVRSELRSWARAEGEVYRSNGFG